MYSEVGKGGLRWRQLLVSLTMLFEAPWVWLVWRFRFADQSKVWPVIQFPNMQKKGKAFPKPTSRNRMRRLLWKIKVSKIVGVSCHQPDSKCHQTSLDHTLLACNQRHVHTVKATDQSITCDLIHHSGTVLFVCNIIVWPCSLRRWKSRIQSFQKKTLMLPCW